MTAAVSHLTFERFIGQPGAVTLLRRMIASGRVPHGILLSGPAGIGKTTLARTFAAALLCRERDDDACGRCRTCVRLLHLNYPDFLYVSRPPKKDDDLERRMKALAEGRDLDDDDLKSVITVDQIRDLTSHVGFAPRESSHRVCLIEPAGRLNDEAQNALLKTLEEPPSTTVLVLAASSPHVLLPTVRSRCIAVGLSPMAGDALAAALTSRGVSRHEARERAAVAEGRPGIALTVDLDARRGRRLALLEDLEELAGSPRGLANLAGMASRLGGRDRGALEEGLDLVQALLRDAARLAAGTSPDRILHRDLVARLEALGARLGPRRAAALVETIDRLRDRMRFHPNRMLICDVLLAAVAGGPVPPSRPDP